MANPTASPSGVNRYLAGRSRNTTDVNTQLMASVETSVGTAISAAPCSVASESGMPSSVQRRWVFSIVTVESSTNMPTASARPPSVIVFSVSPRKYSTVSDDRTASGNGAFAQHAIDRVCDEYRLVEQLVDLEPGRRGGADCLQRLLHAVDDRQRRSVAVLDDAEQNRPAAILAHDVLLHQRSVTDLRHVLQKDGGAVGELDRHHVEVVDRRRCRVGSHRILCASDLRRSRRQRQVLRIDRIDD